MKEKKIFIIHHNADLDWVFWWAILKRAYPSAILVPMQYWDNIDIQQMEWHYVFMVDFSLAKDQMKRLNENTTFVWLDHHISAMKDMEWLEIDWIRDTKMAGCLLAHIYVTWSIDAKNPMDDAIRLISDYDIRNKESDFWRDAMVLPFQYGMREIVWLNVIKTVDILNSFCLEWWLDIIDKWEAILSYQKKLFKTRCSKAWEIDFDWYKCIALMWPKWGNSLVFDSVYDKEKHDMMVYIRYSIKDKNYTLSLYSETIDTSIVAKKHWWWWHAWASWFMCEKLPFNI